MIPTRITPKYTGRQGETPDAGRLFEGREMDCPHCGQNGIEHWQSLYTHTNELGASVSTTGYLRDLPTGYTRIREGTKATREKQTMRVEWMECPNIDCEKRIVSISTWYWKASSKGDGTGRAEEYHTWIAYPQLAVTTVDPAVPAELAADYREAAAIAELSPRMAGVLVRGILADLLEAHGYKSNRLTVQVGLFLKDKTVPGRVRALAEPLRAIGDFGAHGFRDEGGNRIPLAPDESNWALIIIDRLFDHFYVDPERDRVALESVNQMVARAGRDPLRDPEPDEETIDDSAES